MGQARRQRMHFLLSWSSVLTGGSGKQFKCFKKLVSVAKNISSEFLVIPIQSLFMFIPETVFINRFCKLFRKFIFSLNRPPKIATDPYHVIVKI